MVSLLRAWKVTVGPTVVGIECNRAAFNVILRRSTPEIDFFQNSASKMANCIIVDIVNYLMLLLGNS